MHFPSDLRGFNLDWKQDVVVFLEDFFHGVVEVGIANARTVQAGEEIGNEAKEERDVFEHELRKVHVSKRSHQHNILWKYVK